MITNASKLFLYSLLFLSLSFMVSACDIFTKDKYHEIPPLRYSISWNQKSVQTSKQLEFTLKVSGSGKSINEKVYLGKSTALTDADAYIGDITIIQGKEVQEFSLKVPLIENGYYYICLLRNGAYSTDYVKVELSFSDGPVKYSIANLLETRPDPGKDYSFKLDIQGGKQTVDEKVYLSENKTFDESAIFIGDIIVTANTYIYTVTMPFVNSDKTYYLGLSKSKLWSKDALNVWKTPARKITVKGTVQYEHVPVDIQEKKLDLDNIVNKPAQHITVKLLDSNNKIIDSVISDNNGDYICTGLIHGSFTIQMFSEMIRIATSKNYFYVIPYKSNYRNWERYIVSSEPQNLNEEIEYNVNLTAMDSNRGNGPFAILDTINKIIEKIYSINPTASFPDLYILWSRDSSEGPYFFYDKDDKNYMCNKIFLPGVRSGNSDEFDTHVVAHEMNHFLEKNFSRSDSIGGGHGPGDYLDPRVAFSEGFGNAMSGIYLEDPVYVDTASEGGFSFNLESAPNTSKGYFSEFSIQSIIWDLYDDYDVNEAADTLSMGFKPLWEAFVSMKNTASITWIHEYILELRKNNPGNDEAITSILGLENIAAVESEEKNVIADVVAYVQSLGVVMHTCDGSTGLYHYNPIIPVLTSDYPETPHAGSQYAGAYQVGMNKLFGSQFFKIIPTNTGTMTVTATDTKSNDSNPMIYIYQNGVCIKSAERIGSNSSNTCYYYVKAYETYIVEIRTFSGFMFYAMTQDNSFAKKPWENNPYKLKIDLP